MSLLFLLAGGGFGSLFAVRAWRDVRIFTVWRPATCTIESKEIRSTSGSGRSKPSHRPDITFTYEVDGKPYRCTGWDSWALAGDYGGGSYAYYERVLERYAIGATYPCWYDPADPSRAVLVRRVRGLYLLAFVPLLFAASGAFGVWATLANPKRRAGRAGAGRERAGTPETPVARRLAVRLQPDSRPGEQSCGALLAAAALLFVGGIAGYAAWSEAQDGSYPILPWLFVVVFGGLGLVFLWITAASALASRVPETIVEVARSTIPPGGDAELLVVQPGPLRLRSLAVRLTCREEVREEQGSPRVAVSHDDAIVQLGPTVIGGGSPLERAATLRIPAEGRPSRGGSSPVRWRVEVRGVPLVWPRFTLTYPITVAGATAPSDHPSAVTREA